MMYRIGSTWSVLRCGKLLGAGSAISCQFFIAFGSSSSFVKFVSFGFHLQLVCKFLYVCLAESGYFESNFKIQLLKPIFRVIQIPFGKIKYTACANHFGRQRTFLSQRTYIRFSKFQIFQKFHNFQIYRSFTDLLKI